MRSDQLAMQINFVESVSSFLFFVSSQCMQTSGLSNFTFASHCLDPERGGCSLQKLQVVVCLVQEERGCFSAMSTSPAYVTGCKHSKQFKHRTFSL